MSRRNAIELTLSVFVASSCMAIAVAAADKSLPVLRGQVVSVHDGDSFTLLVADQKIKIRLAQIDAPELKQPYGTQSKAALASMLSNRRVRAEVVEIDRYGRNVAEVYLDGRHINRDMVELGHAWAYPEYARSIHVVELEDVARAAVRGLWRLPEDQRDAPWVWRHPAAKRSQAAPIDPSEFACGSKRRCSEMTSCAEARFHLTECGLRLDGDRDGTPCESLCER